MSILRSLAEWKGCLMMVIIYILRALGLLFVNYFFLCELYYRLYMFYMCEKGEKHLIETHTKRARAKCDDRENVYIKLYTFSSAVKINLSRWVPPEKSLQNKLLLTNFRFLRSLIFAKHLAWFCVQITHIHKFSFSTSAFWLFSTPPTKIAFYSHFLMEIDYIYILSLLYSPTHFVPMRIASRPNIITPLKRTQNTARLLWWRWRPSKRHPKTRHSERCRKSFFDIYHSQPEISTLVTRGGREVAPSM